MVNKNSFLFIFVFFIFTFLNLKGLHLEAFAANEKILLNQEKVTQLVVEKSQKAQEIKLKYDQMKLEPYQKLSTFDWTLIAETGYDWDHLESASHPSTLTNQIYRTNMKLKKTLLTGTNLSFDYSRNSMYGRDSSVSNLGATQNTGDLLGMTVEQNLWGNAFGIADRSVLEASELNYQANTFLRSVELQNLVLEALQLYWNTYVAQENFKEALSSRERYEKFVGVLKKKTAYGYSNNYEVFQIQAELENREQVIKTTSAEYLKNSELIIQLLNLPKGAILEFPNIEAIPDIPAHQNKEIKQLRSLKSQNAKIKAAEASLVASQSTRFPLLALTGSLSTSGYDENPSITESHLISGSFPKYSVGIKFATTFGSDFTSQDLFNKRTTLDLEKTRLQRIEEETENKMSTAERKIETTYFSVQSIKKQVDLRQKTLNEMQRSYNDGRMDISFLIDGMNKLFSTQILYTRSIGDYFIALNELAALNDELIINTQEVH